jgi:hypothetical protein
VGAQETAVVGRSNSTTLVRLEALAEKHPLVSEPLMTIAGNVRNSATVLAVLMAAKGPKPI